MSCLSFARLLPAALCSLSLHDALPILMVVHLVSPSGKYDTLYLRNYLRLHIKDQLAGIPGVGDAQPFGGGDYAMRLWLDPDKVAARGMTAGDVVRAVREQNIQVSAGQLGAEPMPGGSEDRKS